MKIGGKHQVVRGAVLFALADTLAAHTVGGFKVGVGFALRKCRMCLATKEQLSIKVLLPDMHTVHADACTCIACTLTPLINQPQTSCAM